MPGAGEFFKGVSHFRYCAFVSEHPRAPETRVPQSVADALVVEQRLHFLGEPGRIARVCDQPRRAILHQPARPV